MRYLHHLALVGALCAAAATAAPKKPNIVFIFTDDQAPDTVAAANIWGSGSSGLKTPNMDRLVNAGTLFSQAYNMGAWHGAVCVASRSMLNSGRFIWQARQADQTKFDGMIGKQQLWSQRMKAAGYETYMTGKWHITAPAAKIFDHTTHVRPGMPGSVKSAYNRPLEGQPDTWRPWDKSNGGYWQGGKHWSEVLADDAGAYIKQAAAGDKPFFMYLAFNAPHDPRQAPKSFVDMYPAARVPLPENFQALNPHHAAMGLGPAGQDAMRDEALAPFPRTEFAVKTHRSEYYACVSHLDTQMGRIIDALEQAGVAENTYIIFTSDHGLAVGRHGLIGKQSMFEHSLRVPFVITGPGIPKGAVRDARIYMQDAMATSLDLAGADADKVDFKSVMPLIRGERKTQYEAIYGAFTEKNQRTIIDGDHKLILYPTSKTVLLFDLAKDPLEMRDLAADPATLALRQRLFAKLLALQHQLADPLDLTASFQALATP